MKITQNGFLFELDTINFRAGAVLMATIQLPDSDHIIAERVRSIKHYDRFFRKPPKKKSKAESLDVTSAGVALSDEDKPKKLVEFHFVQLSSENRMVLHRYLMQLSVETIKKAKK
ncbi:MAG: hypothetical protein AABZ31_15490 [Bdellovibrionota bacterium]